MECTILTIDANSNPIVGAAITLDSQTAITGEDGRIRMGFRNSLQITLNISHSNYLSEVIQFQGSVSTGKYNNALLSRDNSTNPLTLMIRLCRCRAMPVAKMDNGGVPTAELVKLAEKMGDAKAALIWKPHPEGGNPGWMYRRSWMPSKPIRTAEQTLLPENAPTDKQLGWDRFNHTIAKPDVEIQEKSGRFFWLNYGVGNEDSFAVFIWSPNILVPSPPFNLDMIFYFTPTTSAYPVKYPYGMQSFKGDPDQRYMTLGRKHFEEEKMFVYQLAAEKRQAVLVMPVANKGNWGPFTSGEGLLRLGRELFLFLHRECRTSNLLNGIGSVNPIIPEMRHAGATLRESNQSCWGTYFGEPPGLGICAVTFFSNGSVPAKKLMTTSDLDTKSFAKVFWGCPKTMGRANPEALFTKKWCEIWDLDGWHKAGETGSWDEWLTLLQNWKLRNSGRIIRLCHSSSRNPVDPRTHKHDLWRMLIGEGIVYERKSMGTTPEWAREIHGRLWSVVAFDDGYICRVPGGDLHQWETGGMAKWINDQVAPPKDLNPPREPKPLQAPWLLPKPSEVDAHEATPRVGFSHCLALSTIGTRQGH